MVITVFNYMGNEKTDRMVRARGRRGRVGTEQKLGEKTMQGTAITISLKLDNGRGFHKKP